jgi:hypothetical protein
MFQLIFENDDQTSIVEMLIQANSTEEAFRHAEENRPINHRLVACNVRNSI